MANKVTIAAYVDRKIKQDILKISKAYNKNQSQVIERLLIDGLEIQKKRAFKQKGEKDGNNISR